MSPAQGLSTLLLATLCLDVRPGAPARPRQPPPGAPHAWYARRCRASRFRLAGAGREPGPDAGCRARSTPTTRRTTARPRNGATSPVRAARRRFQRRAGGAPGIVRPPHAAAAPLTPRRCPCRVPGAGLGALSARQALRVITVVVTAIVALPRAAAQDTAPPTVSISPASGYTGSSPMLTVAVPGCDSQSAVTDATLSLNGDGLSYSQSSPASDCSGPSSVFTTTVALQVGTNTLVATVCDHAGNCAQASASYVRLDVGVRVAPDGTPVVVPPGASGRGP